MFVSQWRLYIPSHTQSVQRMCETVWMLFSLKQKWNNRHRTNAALCVLNWTKFGRTSKTTSHILIVIFIRDYSLAGKKSKECYAIHNNLWKKETIYTHNYAVHNVYIERPNFQLWHWFLPASSTIRFHSFQRMVCPKRRKEVISLKCMRMRGQLIVVMKRRKRSSFPCIFISNFHTVWPKLGKHFARKTVFVLW